MATTTNFGFSTPDDTGLVKDGALNIRTLGSAVDTRFGDVTNYPNQIVNVVSGVSRPLPYAMAVGGPTGGGTAGGTITFPASRFTVAPIVTVTTQNPASQIYINTVTASSFAWATVGNNSGGVYWNAVQMKSGTAAG